MSLLKVVFKILLLLITALCLTILVWGIWEEELRNSSSSNPVVRELLSKVDELTEQRTQERKNSKAIKSPLRQSVRKKHDDEKDAA